MTFVKTMNVRWSDLGADHSIVPATYAAYAMNTGVEWLRSVGCTVEQLFDLGVGSVLLKEQTEYYQELSLGEEVNVQAQFAGSSTDNAKWKFVYEMYNSQNQLVAKHVVYGAWVNSTTKKIATPPQKVLGCMAKIPHTDDFEIITTTRH